MYGESFRYVLYGIKAQVAALFIRRIFVRFKNCVVFLQDRARGHVCLFGQVLHI